MKKQALIVASCIFLLPGAASAADAKKPPPWRLHLARHMHRPVVNTPTEVTPLLAERREEIRQGWEKWRRDYRTHMDYLDALAAAQEAVQETAEIVGTTTPAPSALAPAPTSGIDWELIAACESGVKGVRGSANWHIDSTYDGGLQFHPDTWLRAKGGQYAPYAYLATREQQIAAAEYWVSLTGCVHCSSGWPRCGVYG